MFDPTYIIGIDLGTTNCIVAYTEAKTVKGRKPAIHIFEISQITAPGVVEKRQALPSFLLVPKGQNLQPETTRLPWQQETRQVVGEYARERGSEIPDQLISSSKSWLCQELVDPDKNILPWKGGEEGENRLSPVTAAAKLLDHIRLSWNHEMAGENPAFLFEHQDIFLTVPASFDAVARDLTVKAAEKAGLMNVTLLEEPQAAFYAWIESNFDTWRESVSAGDVILVCDIGGGTSDFSLIRVDDELGDLVLERIAVGEHLLVGGDNMDLALAYTVAGDLKNKGRTLDAWQMNGLSHSCRKAKETLLSGAEASSVPVTVLGRGSSLIGGTIKTDLARQAVEQVIVDGFFPVCSENDRPSTAQRIGLQEAGLSYETDPRITRHIAKFLHNAGREGKGAVKPSAILFNGGVMKSPSVRERIVQVVSSWQQPAGTGSGSIREIDARDYDLSVARGAAYYGIARRGEGVRIRGGLGRSYYIGIAAAMPAVPGMPAPLKALCVAPFGMEEGSELTLENREFVLVVGEPVVFEILCSASRFDDPFGAMIEAWEPGTIEPLTTIEATPEGDPGKTIPVRIEVTITAVGTLEFWCVSRDSTRRWKFEFGVREKSGLES